MTRLDDFFQRFGITVGDLRGAEVRAEIPLTNAVVNRFIAEQLAKRQTPLDPCPTRGQGRSDEGHAAGVKPLIFANRR